VRDHVVVVPRRYLPDVCALLSASRGIDALVAVIEVAEEAASNLPTADRLLTFNVGRRQEVAQLHGHLLPTPAARLVVADATGWIEVPRGDHAALRVALEGAARSLGQCARGVDGSLVVTGLGTATWRFATAIAPATGNE
jgi:diadenosine tetraphosphate (Ap4A) HIT family hydrolase